jgi:hypothetical protein
VVAGAQALAAICHGHGLDDAVSVLDAWLSDGRNRATLDRSVGPEASRTP